ncbi:carboxylating nicotinate-nucleotide diphosphorylase [Hippea alviniae]|uniref:carboxylating nicotinate-nucleotide diphosphorylase n=1 Tax=Hippea alviniae TaxID=1279027 RepID=UPI0003B31065|nr:carboxylating nicotinate-nucleotide diphosphorylase [Hippea alviniae]
MNPIFLKKLFELYLLEDAFFEDITTESIFEGKRQKAIIRAKEDFVLAGSVFLSYIFKLTGYDFDIKLFVEDGKRVKKGDVIAEIVSADRAILYVERVCLNLLQRLSGIATKTRRFVELIEPFKAKIVDTRKTTPGMRYFEKYAVKVGGGINHRMGLFDAVLIKDNHIKAAGGIKSAIERVKKHVSFTAKIEVECADLEMVKDAFKYGADIIMLDNMSLNEMREAVDLCKGRVLLEASGNINESNIVDVAKTGVDFISSGSIVHHACWVDINMKLE